MRHYTAITLLALTLALPNSTYASGCGLIKALYEGGQYQQAFKTAKIHANYGDPCAQHYLGLMYYKGRGTKADYILSSKYTMDAIKQNYKPAILFYRIKE